MLSVFSAVDFRRSAVQALIIVPSRELGIQVCSLLFIKNNMTNIIILLILQSYF